MVTRSIRFFRPVTLLPRTLLGLACVVLLAGCARSVEPVATAAAPAPFEVFTVESREMADERLIDGRIEGLQQATVMAQIPAQVVAVLQDAESAVAAGEPILRLRATQSQGGLPQAEAALREAEAFAVDAEARYQRIAALYERKVVPRATYDQVLAQREAAVARRAAAGAARDAAAAYTLVPAPFAGVVTERLVRVGDTVAPGTPLFGVAATEALRVRAQLPESWVTAARESRKVVIHHQGQRIPAQNILIYAGADTVDGSFGLQADVLQSVPTLAPGMLVKVGVAAGQRSGVRIPQSAVVERGEVTGVYVHGEGGTRFRQLRLGAVVDGEVEVHAGLSAGEQVARRPAEALRALRDTSGEAR